MTQPWLGERTRRGLPEGSFVDEGGPALVVGRGLGFEAGDDAVEAVGGHAEDGFGLAGGGLERDGDGEADEVDVADVGRRAGLR